MIPRDALRVLGVELPPLEHCRTRAEAVGAFKAWKADVATRAWRGLKHRNHPDRSTPHDSEQRARACVRLDRALEVVLGLTPRLRPAMRDRTTVAFGVGGFTAAGRRATTTLGGK